MAARERGEQADSAAGWGGREGLEQLTWMRTLACRTAAMARCGDEGGRRGLVRWVRG